MAKYQPEQLFDVAKSAYDELYGIIDEITSYLRGAGVDSAKTSDLITYVDAILQVCLLNGSFADGEIETNELIFIKNIAKSTDVLIPINNSIMQLNPKWSYVEWEQIPLLDPTKQRTLISASVNVIKPYATNFIGMLATVDAVVKQRDYLSEVTNRFSKIFVALSGIDGDDFSQEAVKSEGTLAFACYKVLVVDKWNQTLKEKEIKEKFKWQS